MKSAKSTMSRALTGPVDIVQLLAKLHSPIVLRWRDAGRRMA